MKFLIIQTAFIGDVVLATSIVEKLKQHYPLATIDFLVRKGNESLLANNPHLRTVIVFDKKKNKYRNLFQLVRAIRTEKYDYVINAQRFFTTGLMTVLSGARHTIGFDKNPLSYLFNEKVKHDISATGNPQHEVERNLKLIEKITDSGFVKPRLYPSEADYQKVAKTEEYICIAPASVWFTKQFPASKWIELINKLSDRYMIYLIGSQGDISLCEEIKQKSSSMKVEILSGQLSFLESAALMKNAKMNYVNDSAPLHFASAMNAPVTAIFCSTLPEFGFGPLSDISFIGQIEGKLYCRPCGLHGRKACPEGHFKCSEINTDKLVNY